MCSADMQMGEYSINFHDLVALLCILYWGCSRLPESLGRLPVVRQLAAEVGFDVASYLLLQSWFSYWSP